jgi:hypothetical protein
MLQKRTIGIVVAIIIAYVVIAAFLVNLINTYGNAAIIVSAMSSVALVFVTAGLVVATFAYTEAANRQAEAMNRQAQAQEEHVKATDRQVAALTDPVVFFGVEEVSMVDQFFVQNVGPGIAYNVNFEVIKDFDSAILVDDQRLSDLAFIKNPLKTLAPGQKISFAVIKPFQENLFKETIKVKVSYKNKLEAKESFEKPFPIEFAFAEGMREVRVPSIPENVKKIAESIEKMERK